MKAKNSNFEEHDGLNFFQPYDIVTDNIRGNDCLVIIIENTQNKLEGYKIGQLVNETNDLSEFYSSIQERFDEYGDRSEETFILTYTKVEIERITWVITLLSGVTLVAAGLYILAGLFC